MISKIYDYCKDKKHDCSDCRINPNHEAISCGELLIDNLCNKIYNQALQDYRLAIENRIIEKNKGLLLCEAIAIEEGLRKEIK